MEKNGKILNPVCTILWQDAAYTDDLGTLDVIPSPTLTCGFIIETNDEYTNIASSVSYDNKTKKIVALDGFIIPEKAILEFRKIDFYEKGH